MALADPLAMFAQPHGTFAPDDAVAEVQRIHGDTGIEAIVIGWPLEPDGGEGVAVRRVVPFFNRLRKLFPDTEIIQWDERYSSSKAMDSLVEAGVPKGRRRDKGRLDRAAAAIILQEYLDERRSMRAHPDL